MITVSNSRLACFRRCPRKYEYRYVDQLTANDKAPALMLGSLVHESLAEFYSLENNDKDVNVRASMAMAMYDNKVAEAATEVLSAGGDSERFDKDSFMGRQMLKYYFEEVAPNDDFTPVASELKVEVRVPNPNGKFSWCTFIGYVDAIVERDGRLYILEHKTAKTLDTKHLITDTQVTQYIWALRQMGYDVCGVYYNILRKCDPYSARTKAPYHYREAVYRNEREVEECGRQLYNQYMAMKHADRYGFYCNPTRDCSWDCEYRPICIAEMEGRLDEADLHELAGVEGFHVKQESESNKNSDNEIEKVIKNG